MQNSKKMIAYEELKSLIIDNGFCTLCGACEAACPTHAIKVEAAPRRIYDCSENLDLCPICYDICPHTDALIHEVTKFVSEASHRRESLGYYRSILLAQATSPTIRGFTKSAGVVNALLSFAMEQKMIDSAIIARSSPHLILKLQPSISLVPDDALSAVASKVVPCAVAEAFGRAVYEYGKTHIAFVGIPCQILAIRKLEAWQHKIIDSLRVTIGLFCLWTFSLDRLSEYLLHEYGVAPSEIVSMDLTIDEYVIKTLDNRVLKIPLSEVKEHIMNSCRTCPDFTAEYSDLSIGDGAPLKGWSLVIVRTRKGEELLEKAVKAGVVRVREVASTPEVLAHIIHISTRKKESALKDMADMRSKGLPVPMGAEVMTKPTLSELYRLEDIPVKAIMTKNVLTLSSKATVAEFFDAMAKHHHVGFPVKNEEDKIAGIVTLHDAMKVPPDKRNSTLLESICSRNLITVSPEDSVAEAFEKMLRHDIGRLLVMDGKGQQLLGIITRSDVMNALRKAS
ncbi:Coenzyme F420 hydrogenase/dehydrogenase, beta subunit C-terminal domain [Candidatus Bathyarchaeota archaeon]|nr:Coenzyme F420 hydrogenase/dehydrogenase, beta subunit C-terminal domain [Candidatus Bathyarchaeota archaeon]